MIDDPGTEQEHEQRRRERRTAGPERDVAEDVQEGTKHAHTRDRVGEVDQPIKHSIRPMPRTGRPFGRISHDRVASANRNQTIVRVSTYLPRPAEGRAHRRKRSLFDLDLFEKPATLRRIMPPPAARPGAWARTCAPKKFSCCP